MLFRKLALIVLLCSAAPLLGSKHTWLGTSSDRMSDPANWSGGSPVGDAEATIIFDGFAERRVITNDVPGFRFKTLTFEASYYEITGEAMTIWDGAISGRETKISCPLRIEGTLAISGDETELAGPISGSGGLSFSSAEIAITGTRSNTYTGDTVMDGGLVQLRKRVGAIAIPGDLRAFNSELHIQAPEQIADAAGVYGDGLTIFMEADESIGSLDLGWSDIYSSVDPLPTLTSSQLHIRSNAQLSPNLRLRQNVQVQAPYGRLQSMLPAKVIVPDEGIALLGSGSISWAGDYAAPTRIEGVGVSLTVPNSDVSMTSGMFQGTARSIRATGGTLGSAAVFSSGIHLSSGARVQATPSMPIRLNGTLDLGGASLITHFSPHRFGTVVLFENASEEPVIGTFAGIEEGGIVDHRFRVSYRGGSGNDVTLTDLHKPFAKVALIQTPSPAYVDEDVMFEVTLTGSSGFPTGSISYRLGVLGERTSVPIFGGKAVFSMKFATHFPGPLYVDYSGDATYARSKDHYFGNPAVDWRQPTFNSIDPPTATIGTVVTVTLRGSDFHPKARLVSIYPIGPDGSDSVDVVFISPWELRATIDLSSSHVKVDVLSRVSVQQGNSSSRTLDFQMRAPVEPPSILSFDHAGAIGNVTPGAMTAWMTTLPPLGECYSVTTDHDADGVVRRSWSAFSSPPDALWSVVDLTSGNFAVHGSGYAYGRLQPFPAYTFLRDSEGNASRFMLPLGTGNGSQWLVMWARPGVGAWIQTLTDASDDDKFVSQRLVGSVEPMTPLSGSPPHPTGFAHGDVVIMLPFNPYWVGGIRYFAGRLGDELDLEAPGVLLIPPGLWWRSERDGVVRLPVLRTNGATGTVSVRYSTVEGSAKHGVHFSETSGTLTFAPGQTIQWIEVPLIDDAIFRSVVSGENGLGAQFNVVLSDPVGATLGEDTAFVVRIADDDPRPVVSIDGPVVRNIFETDALQLVTIPLKLTGAHVHPITVQWRAISYGPRGAGEVTFASGETQKNAVIAIEGNDGFDNVEEIRIDFGLSWPVVPRMVTIRLLDDDAFAHVSATDVIVDEASGSAQATLSVTPVADHPRFIFYATSDGTAAMSSDYVATSGALKFPAGQAQATITIPILNDSFTEGDESFDLTFDYSAAYVSFERSTVHVVVVDDEVTTRPTVSIDDVEVVEPEGGLALAAFTVRLSAATTRTVTVNYYTVDATAIGGLDYQSVEERIVFAPGETEKTLALLVFGDPVDEETETFGVILGSALNATLLDGSGTATIVDNDIRRRRGVGK